MDLVLDHLVHAVESPDMASADFAGQLGWRTFGGGRHPNWGTYNALCYFDLSYIEWVGVFDEVIASTSEFGRWVHHDLALGEGLSQFVLRTRALDEIADNWHQRGLLHIGPMPGERQRPDGTVLRWRLLFPGRPDAHVFPLPFVIEWEEDDETRRAQLIASGALPANGKSPWRLAAVHSAVADVRAARERWEAYYGTWLPVTERDGAACVDLGGAHAWFWNAGTAGLQQRLAARGERPFQIDLVATGTGETDTQSLRPMEEPAKLTLHGLDVRLVPSAPRDRTTFGFGSGDR